ncbi:MAG: transcription-repair coupling factor [Akkermansia sp.]
MKLEIPSLFSRVAKAPGFATIVATLKAGDNQGRVTPCILDHTDPAGLGFAIALGVHQASPQTRIWIITPHLRAQESIFSELYTWGIPHPIFLPEQQEDQKSSLKDPELAAERLHIFQELSLPIRETQVIVLTRHALDEKCPAFPMDKGRSLTLHVGGKLDPDDLIAELTKAGFEQLPQVISRGQWSKRGGIIDVFPLQAAAPLRIELFDDEIESLREFDIDTQISFKKLTESLLLLEEAESLTTLRSSITSKDWIISTPYSAEPGNLAILNAPPDEAQGVEDFSNAIRESPIGSFDAGDFVMQEMKRNLVGRQLKEWHDKKWEIAIFFPNSSEEERFREICVNQPQLLKAHFLRGELPHGFTVPSAKLAVLSSAELFGRYQSSVARRRATREDQARKDRAQASLREINPGDLVVHSTHGIGKFIRIALSDDTGDEEMQILYRDNTVLHIPLSQSHLVCRYIGLGNKAPELNKLGDARWQKAKKSAEKAVEDYAAQLLQIQAQRTTNQGCAHPPDNKWMWEFENSFPYKETPDQLRAIAQTKADMETDRPMDRLICGDVGFGKTEVALRAAFKCVTGGKQVALLVPTTVLAEQHTRTFRSRMSEYPIRIEMLSRFTPTSEVRSILEGLAKGSVDIVIGTHRLISEDVAINNLGLVVIDEEQRFGVRHKEKFKDRFRGIDILTLSATPIPRTLYIALMGTRDMSTIETPPLNRIPVQTSVCPYDERIIRSAVEREMERGGQVFFLHNRVKTIEHIRDRLHLLVPKARIAIGHGQMDKEELGQVMGSFVRGEVDILLSTTIIESGIDIPNANTIIIDRADRFGLADLYQLRGRVGRSGHLAYAYLMLPRSSITTTDARKRVSAIKQYSELGSGFKIAMRDLEIRGAGNLLGTQQSGHIAAIGFDLYCQLLRQSIDSQQGKIVVPRTDAALRTDFIIFSEAQYAPKAEKKEKDILGAFIPSHYIEESKLRIEAYKDLANARETSELDSLSTEWLDRFGTIPSPVEHLLLCQKIKILASKAQISLVEISAQRLMLTRNGDFILLGNKFPRLQTVKPLAKLKEAYNLLQKL